MLISQFQRKKNMMLIKLDFVCDTRFQNGIHIEQE